MQNRNLTLLAAAIVGALAFLTTGRAADYIGAAAGLTRIGGRYVAVPAAQTDGGDDIVHLDNRGGVRVSLTYGADEQTAAHRGPISVVDSTSIAGLTSTATGRISVAGKPSVCVSARFTDSAATCKVRLLRSYVDSLGAEHVLGLSAEQTLTASSFIDSSGYYVAPDATLTTDGATRARVVLSGAVSAGSVYLWNGCH